MTSFERCLASAAARKETHYERQAVVTRRVMAARDEPEWLIAQRSAPDWWKHAEFWDEDAFDGDTDPQFHSYVEQDAIGRILRAVHRETRMKAIIGRYKVRTQFRWSRYDITPVLHWTIWRWRKKLTLKPHPPAIDDVTRYLAAERTLWLLHDQYDPDGSRIAEIEAARREEREWEARRRRCGALAAYQPMAAPVLPTSASSAINGGTRVPLRVAEGARDTVIP